MFNTFVQASDYNYNDVVNIVYIPINKIDAISPVTAETTTIYANGRWYVVNMNVDRFIRAINMYYTYDGFVIRDIVPKRRKSRKKIKRNEYLTRRAFRKNHLNFLALSPMDRINYRANENIS